MGRIPAGRCHGTGPTAGIPRHSDFFTDLIAVRQAHPALRRGGLRWVIAGDDAIGFLRETVDQRILVVSSRSSWPGALLPAALSAGKPETLYGDADLRVTDGAIAVPGAGPNVGIWRLA